MIDGVMRSVFFCLFCEKERTDTAASPYRCVCGERLVCIQTSSLDENEVQLEVRPLTEVYKSSGIEPLLQYCLDPAGNRMQSTKNIPAVSGKKDQHKKAVYKLMDQKRAVRIENEGKKIDPHVEGHQIPIEKIGADATILNIVDRLFNPWTIMLVTLGIGFFFVKSLLEFKGVWWYLTLWARVIVLYWLGVLLFWLGSRFKPTAALIAAVPICTFIFFSTQNAEIWLRLCLIFALFVGAFMGVGVLEILEEENSERVDLKERVFRQWVKQKYK